MTDGTMEWASLVLAVTMILGSVYVGLTMQLPHKTLVRIGATEQPPKDGCLLVEDGVIETQHGPKGYRYLDCEGAK